MNKCPVVECNLYPQNCGSTKPHTEIYRKVGPCQSSTDVIYFECIRYQKFFEDDGEKITEIPKREDKK
jgi:hypothetical protein